METGRAFEAINESGETVECEVIMLYHALQNDKEYVFYTDQSYDEDGSLNLYASRYLGEEDGKMILEDVQDEREWQLLDKALEEAKDGLKESEN